MSGTPSPKQSSSSGSAASFIKVVQSLIQSDDEQIRIKKMYELQNMFPVLKKMNPNLSNQEKLNIFLRDNNFKNKFFQKLLQNFHVQKNPPIKIQIYSIRYRSSIESQLDQSDLIKIFNNFGKISFIYVQKTSAYLQYESLISSYLAIQTLNQFQIVRDLIKLQVRWCKNDQQNMAEQLFFMKFNSINIQDNQKYQKYNCKYQIYLPCTAEFKLAQKIIGPKGNNMKKIFQQITNNSNKAIVNQYHAIGAHYQNKATGIIQNKMMHINININDIQKNLKMRLRGRGSGYKQGSRQQQSDQILNFCISSKQKILYEIACTQIQKLLQKLSKDYKLQYERINSRILQGIAYKKYQLIPGNSYIQSKIFLLQSISSVLSLPHKKLTGKQIQEEINKRNKARQMGKYKQADQIRQKLKINGVILTDGVGKKNLYDTKWKFIGK